MIQNFDGIGYGYQSRAAFACHPDASRGRLFPQSESPTRSPFQRDRDRIIHTSAFRRLKHKTQVFISHESDHYRTRLTHTIEVAQIARSIARAFRLDEDLAEAVALVHDFGHTPFGHAGERALDLKMAGAGGFDHNAQSLRIVIKLERRYAEFDGLNLTWETLEGLVKHNGPLLKADGSPLKGAVPQSILDFDKSFPLDLVSFASLEAQAAAIADDIAYDTHDIDDGLRAGILTLDLLRDAPLVGPIIKTIEETYPDLDEHRKIAELGRRQITAMVEDVISETGRRLSALQPASAADVRHATRAMIGFSDAMQADEAALKQFLFEHLYRHQLVMAKMEAAGAVIENLFDHYVANFELLPDSFRTDFISTPHAFRIATVSSFGVSRPRAVADFIAGMTDQFAIRDYERLFDRIPVLG